MKCIINSFVFMILVFSMSSFAMDPPPYSNTLDFGKKLSPTEIVEIVNTRPEDLCTLAYISGEIRVFLRLEQADFLFDKQLKNCLDFYDKKIASILNNSHDNFDLDTDILSRVFSFLSPDDCKSFHCVNRKFAPVSPHASVKIYFLETITRDLKFKRSAIIKNIDLLIGRKQSVDLDDLAAVIAKLRNGLDSEMAEVHTDWLFAYNINMALIIFIDLAKHNKISNDYDALLKDCIKKIDEYKEQYASFDCYLPLDGDLDEPQFAGCMPCELFWACILQRCFGPEAYVEKNLNHSDSKMRAYKIARKWNLWNLWDFESKKDR